MSSADLTTITTDTLSDGGVASDGNTDSTINLVEQSIGIMQECDGLCVHPLHYHSFQIQQNGIQSILSSAASSVVSVRNFLSTTTTTTTKPSYGRDDITTGTSTYLTSNSYRCILCGEQFSTLSSRLIPQIFQKQSINRDDSSSTTSTDMKRHNDTTILKCLACNILAHRSCATSMAPVTYRDEDTKLLKFKKSEEMKRTTNVRFYEIHQQCSVNRKKIIGSTTKSLKLDNNVMSMTSTIVNGDTDKDIDPSVDPTTQQSDSHDDHNEATTIQLQQQQRQVTSYPGNRVLHPQQHDALRNNIEHISYTHSSDVIHSTSATKSATTTGSSSPHLHHANKLLSSVKQNMSMTAVAGGIAGGLAGMALIGPAGAVYACYLGAGGMNVLLGLESAATLSLVAAGIATGTITGNKIHDHIDETKQRIITMSDPNRRTVLLVRPNIIIDPIWDQICLDAIKSAPKSAYSSKRQNHQAHADIIYTNEDEIDTNDKILLLVSRILNDKTSLPGYVLRFLIESYKDRCRNRTIICAKNQSIIESNPRIRRDDAHAIIKHVTATLMNVRPEFGSSPRFTELTASAVESIVFGQIYDSVLEEIIHETLDYDVALWRKVTVLLKEYPELLDVQSHDQDAATDHDFPTMTKSTNHKLPLISLSAMDTLKMVHQARSVSDKLHFCVKFIDCISAQYTNHNVTNNNSNINNNNVDDDTDESFLLCADTLIQMVCQHIVIVENYGNLYAQIRFLEEFARDEQLINGYDGYALVTIQAALQVLQHEQDEDSTVDDWYDDIFG